MPITTINPRPGETWLVDRRATGDLPEEVTVVGRYPNRAVTQRAGETTMQLRYIKAFVKRTIS